MADALTESDDPLLAAIAEKRLALRVPAGLSVVLRYGLRRRRGELLDLSLTGARLSLSAPIAAGRRGWLWIPAGLGGRLAHPIGAVVAWSEPQSAAASQAGLAFRSYPLGGRARLRRALGELLERAAEDPSVAPLAERRAAKRIPYGRRVIARGAGAPLVMLGHEISSSGMRVETRRALAVGDTMQLALHAGGSVPLVVRAEVVRSIGEGEWAIAFRCLDAAQRERIDAVLRDRAAGPAAAPSLLVSRVSEPD
jgi:hypothetical protein